MIREQTVDETIQTMQDERTSQFVCMSMITHDSVLEKKTRETKERKGFTVHAYVLDKQPR